MIGVQHSIQQHTLIYSNSHFGVPPTVRFVLHQAAGLEGSFEEAKGRLTPEVVKFRAEAAASNLPSRRELLD